MPNQMPHTFLFDLAGVLVRWDPMPLYLEIFKGDKRAVKTFFTDILGPSAQNEVSRGRATLDIIAELAERHPDYREALEAWWHRWPEMVESSFEETVAITRRLRNKNYRTCILGNWGRDEFDRARERFAFLNEFDGVVISGDVGAMKPEDAIFVAAIDRLELKPDRTLFIDDRAENVAAAQRHGFHGHVFADAPGLDVALRELGVEC